MTTRQWIAIAVCLVALYVALLARRLYLDRNLPSVLPHDGHVMPPP